MEYGGPVRVVFPQLWGYKSAKSIVAVDFLDRDEDGYWETRGYPGDAAISATKLFDINARATRNHRRRRGDMVGERGIQTTCELVVRWYECDTYGHVNNAVYLHYLEFAREHYMRELGISFNEMRAAGIGLYVARISVDYKRPALPEDRLTILTRPLKRTRIGGILGQQVVRGDTLIAAAEVTWVSVNAQGRPSPLPPAFDREGLSP